MGETFTFTDGPEFHAMQTTRLNGISPAFPAMRWGARILSVLLLLFWGWFLLAHLFGQGGRPSRPRLVEADYAILTAVVVSLVGLAVAWRWERLGGTLSLAAVTAGALLNW